MGAPRLGPGAIAYMWNGAQPGWVLLKVPGLEPILYHQPSRSSFVTPAVNLKELMAADLVHGVLLVAQQAP